MSATLDGKSVHLKIYMVTDGSYSDYHVIGVYSTKELAEKVKEIHDARNDIDELNLDEMPDVPPGLLGWSLEMLESGDVLRVWRSGVIKEEEKFAYWRPFSYSEDRRARSGISVYARDPEHAVKVASERRREAIVSGEWANGFKRANR